MVPSPSVPIQMRDGNYYMLQYKKHLYLVLLCDERASDAKVSQEIIGSNRRREE